MQTHTRKFLTLTILLGGLIALPATADHNSIWGAGTANMPNDIHNTRIEDNLDENEWADFVRYGDGSETDNRYLETTTSSSGQAMGGSRR